MRLENELAMVVAFYLSKFGEEGLTRLGFRTYRQAFEEVSRSLHVKPNSVKNWRDEFDPYYDNRRKGWYKRGIRPSRQQVMTAFDDLSEDALRAVVLDIIKPEERPRVESQLHSVLTGIKASDDEKRTKKKLEYVARGPTGRMAEEFFVSRFRAGLTPFKGVLRDYRDYGVGFDFEIVARGNRTLVEVKGLAKELGGISFTDKEWRIANETQNDYFLGLVSNVSASPEIGFMQNPAFGFVPIYHAYATIAVSWNISSEQVTRVELI